MASRTFLLLALAFAVVLLIASEVASAKELASDTDSAITDSGRSGYNRGGGKYNGGGRGGNDNGGGKGGHNNGGGKGGHGNGGGKGGRGGCRFGCCGGGRYSKGCKCCNTFEEAIAYKQTQN